MPDETTLEGWAPEIGGGLTLAEVVERAFDYRGNVTVVRTDGAEVEGYLFNRAREVPAPFVQMYDRNGDGPLTILYAEIRAIRFTGKDMAAGNSYAAWLRARDAAKTTSGAPPAPGA